LQTHTKGFLAAIALRILEVRLLLTISIVLYLRPVVLNLHRGHLGRSSYATAAILVNTSPTLVSPKAHLLEAGGAGNSRLGSQTPDPPGNSAPDIRYKENQMEVGNHCDEAST
jgi:hypothetical protein